MNWLEEYWLRLVFVVAYLALLAHHCLGRKPSKGLSKDDEQDRGKNTIGNFLTGGGTLARISHTAERSKSPFGTYNL